MRYSILQESRWSSDMRMLTGDVISDKQTMDEYGMIDIVEGGIWVEEGQFGHVYIVCTGRNVRINDRLAFISTSF